MNSTTPAGKRYTARVIVLMTFYVAFIFGASWFFNQHPGPGLLRYLVAIAPALPVVGVVWAMGFYMHEETDEYLRMNLARNSLYATGITLSVATIWGFLEQYDTVVHVPSYYAFMVYWAGFGLVQGISKIRERSGGDQ